MHVMKNINHNGGRVSPHAPLTINISTPDATSVAERTFTEEALNAVVPGFERVNTRDLYNHAVNEMNYILMILMEISVSMKLTQVNRLDSNIDCAMIYEVNCHVYLN